MNNEAIIEELNTILRGTYMGIRSMEHYIQSTDDLSVKSTFQSMQQEIKQNAQALAARIQNLGGVPADDEGLSGSFHSFMHKVMLPNSSEAMIKDAIKGNENYGVEYSEEVVKGDLDIESKRIVENIIDTNRRHVSLLKEIVDRY